MPPLLSAAQQPSEDQEGIPASQTAHLHTQLGSPCPCCRPSGKTQPLDAELNALPSQASGINWMLLVPKGCHSLTPGLENGEEQR